MEAVWLYVSGPQKRGTFSPNKSTLYSKETVLNAGIFFRMKILPLIMYNFLNGGVLGVQM